MSDFDSFVALHHAASPVLIGNCWDVSSARLLEENGFKAIATSSAALALCLGYEDGENLPFELLFETVKRIKKSIAIPFSVDLEKGFSTSTTGIIDNIERLIDIGVVGINIEDSSREDERALQSTGTFEKTLGAIANHLSSKNLHLYVNARTDAFLLKLPNALTETKQRISAYEAAGASGIFVPFAREAADITAIVAATTLPVNVLSMPQLPGIATLAALGVRRLSLGSSLYRAVNKALVNKLVEIQQQQSVDPLF